VTPEIREGLREIVELLAGVPALYRDEPRDFAGAGAHVLLEVRSHRRVGEGLDVFSEDLDESDVGHEIGETTRAHLEFVLSLVLESFDHSIHAQDRLMRLRLRLERTSARDALDAIGAVIFHADQVQVLGTKYDQRLRSVAALDLRVRVLYLEQQVSYDADTGTSGGVTYIERVEVNDALIGPALPEEPEPEPEP